MRLIVAVLAAVLALAPAAFAAPPANDNRVDAVQLTPPDTARGTVAEATLEDNEFVSDCREIDASVWYRFTAPRGGSVVIQYDGEGDLDAVVDVYERVRSQLTSVDCDVSDRNGSSTIGLDDLRANREYLVRIGKRVESDPGNFRLQVLVPSPPATPPGRALPRRGVRDSVDRLVNPSDAYHVRLNEGVAYRVDLFKPPGCTSLAIYGPGTRSFGATPVERLGCGGYRLFTPDRSGRYLLLVESARRRGTQPYRLAVGRAGPDDTTPGIFIRNDARVRGRVNGRLDSVDLYRFDVTRRSALTLRVTGGPDLELRTEGGRRIDSGSSIERNIARGRYYVAVRGAGRYRLRRVSRAITHSVTRFAGRANAHAAPGATVALTLGVRPAVDGRGVIVVERFDPLDGWQFLRRYRVTVAGGRASVSFTPPSVGRYRARSEYRGSRIASPSSTGYARLTVNGPLEE